MNTRPPQDPKVRSRWTARDEADLAERVERKRRIMEENRGPVLELVETAPVESSVERGNLVEWLIAEANALIGALTPFASEREGRS